jgi:hypothetical protein
MLAVVEERDDEMVEVVLEVAAHDTRLDGRDADAAAVRVRLEVERRSG